MRIIISIIISFITSYISIIIFGKIISDNGMAGYAELIFGLLKALIAFVMVTIAYVVVAISLKNTPKPINKFYLQIAYIISSAIFSTFFFSYSIFI